MKKSFQIQPAVRFFMAYCGVVMSTLLLSSQILSFDYSSLVYNNITFNLFVYPTYELGGLPQEYSLSSLFRPQAIRYFFATGSGVLIAVFFLRLLRERKMRREERYALGILIVGFTLFIASNSEKDYYSLIFAPAVVSVLGIILSTRLIKIYWVQFSALLAICSSIFWLVERSTPMYCTLNAEECVSV